MFVYFGDKHISTYRFTKLPSEKAITDKNMFASSNNGNKSTKWVLNRTIKTYLELPSNWVVPPKTVEISAGYSQLTGNFNCVHAF